MNPCYNEEGGAIGIPVLIKNTGKFDLNESLNYATNDFEDCKHVYPTNNSDCLTRTTSKTIDPTTNESLSLCLC